MLNSVFMNLLGRESLIAADNTWGLLGVMCLAVAFSIFLEQKYKWASKISGAIIALIIAMILANVGIIPTSSVLYDDIVWGVIVPMGIPLLLLQCNLSRIWKDTGRMLIVWIIGAVGTTVGAFVAYFLLRAPFGDASGLAKVASMMTGSYIGGGVNFAAMASQYAAGEDLTAAATVADNLLMAVYFFVLIAFASFKFFRKHYKHPHIDEVESGTKTADESVTQAAAFWSRKDISLKDIAVNIAYAVAIVWLAQIVSGFFAGIVPENPGPFMDFVDKFFGSQYVWITTFSVIVATCFHKQVEKMHGSRQYHDRRHQVPPAAGADRHHGVREHAVLLLRGQALQVRPGGRHHCLQRQHRRPHHRRRYGHLPGLDQAGRTCDAGRRAGLCRG